ncbi:MAG: ABC-type transport auxiliary lipoprotein family protein [Azonexus sp.]|nr:ABC-type transport auxiliary lipoprotein family protein [Azonexus sp.]
MIRTFSTTLLRISVASLLLALLGACGVLEASREPQPAFYSLYGARPAAHPASTPPVPWSITAPTLIVNPPHAAAGFDSQRIIYTREPHQLQYFAHSEWVDTPARMIAPSIVAALEDTGAFRAVVLTPSAAAGDLRLNVEILRLQHEFASSPSRVRFTLRAYMVDNETRQVIAWREFDETVVAGQDNPYGGVVAANAAVKKVMERLASFYAEAARGWISETGRHARAGN